MMEIARQDNLWLLAPDVACLPGPIVNVYLVGRPSAGDRGWTLIDAGILGMTEQIARAAARRFGADARPAAILLTHGHFDHVGALKKLAERWDTPVYAHPLELPYLTGRSSYTPPDPTVGGGLMSRLSVLFPRGPIDLGARARALLDDGEVPNLPGWRTIHTPGHAPGHVSFFREADRLLIAGDAFVTTKQESFVASLLKPFYIQGPPTYFTPDWPASRRSVEALAALHPASAGTGHGRPVAGERLDEALNRLAREFARLAVPKHGRYVAQPAIADERGVISVPPPALDVQGTRYGGIASALLAAALLVALRRRLGPSR
jgi:glyoxylase-like metal-dependent hydrolase (beta-lactamase superfamily II)